MNQNLQDLGKLGSDLDEGRFSLTDRFIAANNLFNCG